MTHNFYKTQKDITKWLDIMGIISYSLIPDSDYGFVVDVNGYVNLNYCKLKAIPIKFNNIGGSFICDHNSLTTLMGAPKQVGEVFSCSYNNLTSLEGAPIFVGGNFYAADNKLVDMKGITPQIKGNLWLTKNKINNLLFIPKEVGGEILITDNPHPLLKDIKETIYYNNLHDLHTMELEKKLLEHNIKSSSNQNKTLLIYKV